MRVKALVGAAVVSVAVVSLGAQQQISLLASIVDPITNLAAETVDMADLRVSEDGVPAKVLKIEAVTRVVRVQLLIDNGTGIGSDNIGELRKGARGLIEALPEGVETTIVTTAPQPRFLVRATTNREELLKGIERLSPDSGSGRFTESLGEAAERGQKQKDSFTVYIAAGTTAGDGNVQDRDVKRVFERMTGQSAIVHVLLFSGGAARSATGGQMQTEIGLALTKNTGGRYENINTMSRYISLMPELGAEVAKQAAGQTRQFRILVERPDGKKGDLGRVSLGVTSKIVAGVQLERAAK